MPEPTAAAPETPTPAAGGESAGGDGGLANYQSTLGKFLGSKLYEAVSKVLTYESLASAGKSAVDGGAKALVGQFGSFDRVKSDPDAIAALGDMLADAATPAANAWMAKHGPALAASLKGWAGANPEAIASLAVLAAAGAVMANVSLPKLAQKLHLAKGLDAEVEVALGKIRSISLEKISARLAYQSGPLSAAIQVTQEGGETTGTATAGGTVGGVEISTSGTFTDKGLKVAGVGAAVETSAGKLSGEVEHRRGEGTISSLTLVNQDGATTHTDKVSYNSAKGTLTVGKEALTTLSSGGTVGASTSSSSDGSSDAAIKYAYGSEELNTHLDVSSHKDPYQLSESARVAAGLNYKKDDLKFSLDAAFGGGSGSLGGSLEKDLGGGHRAGASAETTFGLGGETLNLGAFYGFKDPASFRQFLVEYSYKSAADEHKLKALLEGQWDYLKMRLSATATRSPTEQKLELSALGAVPMGESTYGVAGFSVLHDNLHQQGQIMPEVGVQHKGVQVLFGFDPGTKSGTLRLGVPF